jgi:hypothetical protein
MKWHARCYQQYPSNPASRFTRKTLSFGKIASMSRWCERACSYRHDAILQKTDCDTRMLVACYLNDLKLIEIHADNVGVAPAMKVG